LKVSFIRTFAHKLAKTTFGQKSMTKTDMPSIFKQQQGISVYFGLFLLTLSCFIILPALAFLTYLSAKSSQPMFIVFGGPVVFLLVHIMFGLGVYLAGKNYAIEVLQIAIKQFLKKYM